MCDYSLHAVKSRPAKVGDKLMTTAFPDTYTRGLAAVDDPEVAVCLLPGTEIEFEKDVQVSLFFGLGRRVGGKLALFRKIEGGGPATHRDALEFPNGQVVLLTHLRRGQSATVLQLPAPAIHQRDDEKQSLETV